MELSIGDEVEITHFDGTKERGIIEVVSSTINWFYPGQQNNTIEYGIRVPSSKWLKYLNGHLVSLIAKNQDFTSLCDCGAVKAALPYKPSGHAYYCLLFKDNK